MYAESNNAITTSHSAYCHWELNIGCNRMYSRTYYTVLNWFSCTPVHARLVQLMIGTVCGHSSPKHQVYDHSFCMSHSGLPEFFYHHHISCHLIQCCFYFVLAWTGCPEVGRGGGAMQCPCFLGQFFSSGAFGRSLEFWVLDQDSCNLLLKWGCSLCLIKILIFCHL